MPHIPSSEKFWGLIRTMTTNDDTQEVPSYTQIIQQEAYAAFNRMTQRMQLADDGVPLEFTTTKQFWLDLLKIMEYSVLR